MAKLKVQGNASGTGVVTLTAPNTNTDRTITLPDGDITLGGGVDGIVSTANATAITIDSSENVGIGVVPETDWSGGHSVLQVGSTGVFDNDGSSTMIGENWKHASGNKYIITSEATRYYQNAGAHIFQVAPSGTADSAISWTTALQITNDGRGLSQFTAKAWVNFNGTGTVAIRDSHNVSSITDNGLGDYTINFSNNMANANYSTVSSAGGNSTDVINDLHSIQIGIAAVGSVRVGDNYTNGGYSRDPVVCNVMVFGD